MVRWKALDAEEGNVMAKTLHKFDYRDIGIAGLELFVTTTPFMPAVVSDGEIDWQIEALKADLDAVGAKMKRALQQRNARPRSTFED